MQIKLILSVILLLLILPVATAETSFFVKKDTVTDITVACANGGFFCSPSALMNITIFLPNLTVMIDNVGMTNQNNGYFNLTLNLTQTNVVGEYTARATAQDGFLNDTTLFTYEVTPDGIRPTDQKTAAITRGILFVGLLAALFFALLIFSPGASVPLKMTYIIGGLLMSLTTINLIFVSLENAVVDTRLQTFFDSFTAISYFVFWFGAAFIIIMWIFTFLNTWMFKKNMANAQRFGGATFG